MLRLEYLKLSMELSPAVIHSWLGHCEDTFESWQAMNPDKTITACTLITLTSLKMEESTAATWWNENHEKLKKLGSWEEFAQEVKDRFIPSNCHMLALATFYSIHQGPSSIANFAKTLQIARNVLAGAGQNWIISDAVLKNHLFFSHPIFHLRVSRQQTLPFTTMKVDTLIAMMSSTWNSMLAEGVIKMAHVP
jgi:hypothetical protein